MKYLVKNIYNTERVYSRHKTALNALKARDKHQSLGWQVVDTEGNTWDWGPTVGGYDDPCISYYAD